MVELLFAMALLGILLTLTASALKTFWIRRALDGSTKQVTAQLRQLQQRAVAESHPLVYGARFTEGSDSYTLLRYNPSDPTPPVCTPMNTLTLEDGVQVAEGTSFEASPHTTLSDCGTVGTDDHFVFFFARGTATGGSLKLTHAELSETTRNTTTISVTNLTGRVEGGS